MKVFIVISNHTKNVMAIYSTYAKAWKDWGHESPLNFKIEEWLVQ